MLYEDAICSGRQEYNLSTKPKIFALIVCILLCATPSICFAQPDSSRGESSADPDANVALEGQCVVVCDAEPVAVRNVRDRDFDRSSNTKGRNGIRKLWDNMRWSCGDLATAASRTPKVAFSVVRRSSLSEANPKSILVFDHVDVNEGNGFETSTGIFKAPASGIYSFSFNVFRIYNSQTLHIQLQKNAVSVFEGFAGGNAGDFSSAHNQGLLQLRKGDVVYLHVAEGDMSGGWIHSTFSGYLIFE